MEDWFARDPVDQRLANNPLRLVVCQVRHEHEVAASDPTRALLIQEELEWVAQLSEQTSQEVSLTIGSGPAVAAPSASSARGWRLASDDGSWIASVLPDSFTLEVTTYPGWDEFRERLARLASAVLKHVRPSLEHRVGLRFVNQINHPEVHHPKDWKGLISDVLLQSELFTGLGDQTQAALQVLQIRQRNGHSLVLRHGTQLDDNRWKYLLDSDSSRQGTRRLSEQSLEATIDQLHRLALQAFELVTTPALRAYLEKEAM